MLAYIDTVKNYYFDELQLLKKKKHFLPAKLLFFSIAGDVCAQEEKVTCFY